MTQRGLAGHGATALRLMALAGMLAVLPVPAQAQLMLQGADPHGQKHPGAQKPATRPAAPKPATPHLTDQKVLDMPLLLNGSATDAPSSANATARAPSGSLRMSQSASGLQARLSLTGRIASSGAVCTVDLTSSPLPMQSLGAPAGLPRYRIDVPGCTLDIDVLEDSVLASSPGEACTLPPDGCQLDASGLWGPEGTALGGKISQIERERGKADTTLRDTFRQYIALSKGPETSKLAAEQAGFSSQRATQCARYVAETSHGLCATRLTQARIALLRARLTLAQQAEHAGAAAPTR